MKPSNLPQLHRWHFLRTINGLAVGAFGVGLARVDVILKDLSGKVSRRHSPGASLAARLVAATATTLALALGLGTSTTVCGHPGVGIVRDSRGNIFYTDIAQVWCLAPDGTQSIVVTNVHTHELCLDAADNLYGEHLWYEGDATRKWGHYVWRRSPDGRVEKIIPPSEGFLTNYSFVRDVAGNMYWADRDAVGGPAIRKRPPQGAIATILQSGSRHDIGFMTCSPNGTVYLIDRSDLIRIDTNGQMRVMARRLSGDRFNFSQRHKVQGLSADDAGNVWVAVSERREVKKISPDGKVTIAARSGATARPNGVLATADGHLWILENSLPNRARVWHIAPGEPAEPGPK